MSAPGLSNASARSPLRPRVGFLGVGWIGLHRLNALVAEQAVDVTAIVDPAPEVARRAIEVAPGARQHPDLGSLLQQDLDGVVIATPSALHAAQATAALQRGVAVFCQKPLALTAAETRGVIRAAREANRLLEVDLCYRFVRPMQRIREHLREGDIGEVYAAELVFHNAYGPDKDWYYRRPDSGGGCVMDLGIHLVDLALWLFEGSRVGRVTSGIRGGGRRQLGGDEVEDYAVAQLELDPGPLVTLTCSWRLPLGCDAQISVALFGSKGGLALHNVGGSFYDFRAERYRGTRREVLDEPPDAWGGRAAVHWARRLAESPVYDPDIERLIEVAAVIDRIYERGEG